MQIELPDRLSGQQKPGAAVRIDGDKDSEMITLRVERLTEDDNGDLVYRLTRP